MNAAMELEEIYEYYKKDPQFRAELEYLLEEYIGCPSRPYYAGKTTKNLGGARTYLRREDLSHTDSHKISNALGRVFLAKKMGRTEIIAGTGAGQHDVAITAAAALLSLECEVYMGKEDTDRQTLNVYRMELLGAKVYPVTNGIQTLEDTVNETLREWTNHISDAHYVIGPVMSPHPFPTVIRDFQSVISREIKEQLMEKGRRLPDMVIACVGGGSSAMGAFYELVDGKGMKLIGCEAVDRGVETEQTAATIVTGRLGVSHDTRSHFCQDEYEQIAPVYSISAGLDYPGIEPEYTQLHGSDRARYVSVIGDEIVDSFEYLPRMEGIISAVGSMHAVVYAKKIAGFMDKNQTTVINLSGREDKDVATITRHKGVELYEQDTAGF